MAPFKKQAGFRGGDRQSDTRGGFRSGGGSRPAFANKGFSRGGDRGPRDSQGGDRPVQLFKATCAECGKTCEVPFRPNGEKPVFCRDCFALKRGSDAGERRDMPSRGASRDFTPRDYDRAPTPMHSKPAPDSRIDDLKRQIDAMNKKLDTVLSLMEESKRPAAKKNEDSLTEVVATVAKKAAKAKGKKSTRQNGGPIKK